MLRFYEEKGGRKPWPKAPVFSKQIPEKKGKAPRPGEGRGAVKESGPPAYGDKEKKNHAPAGPGTP